MQTIRLYALSYCPWCRRAKRFFADHGIAVVSTDYDLATREEQLRIEEEIAAYSGGQVSFPYVVIGDQVIMGYHPDQYAAILGIKE